MATSTEQATPPLIDRIKEWILSLDELIAEGSENAFRAPFLSLWYQPREAGAIEKANVGPLLFINSTQVQGAGHAVFSPVKLPTDTYRGIDILARLAEMEDKRIAEAQGPVEGPRTVPLVTANLLNASFPYINPAGHMSGIGSFVDAGYFDNYGARTGAGILKALSRFQREKEQSADSLARLYQQLEFVSILIRNSTVDQKPFQLKESSQLSAPLGTMASLRTVINDHNYWDLENSADAFFKVDLSKVQMEHKQRILWIHKTDTISPIVPLARYLSNIAIKAMDTAIEQQQVDAKSDLHRLQSRW